MWCFPLTFLYFGEQRGSVTRTNTRHRHQFFPYVVFAVRGWQALKEETNPMPSTLSIWRALGTATMELHVPDNSLLSHSTCFLTYSHGYAFKIRQIRRMHLFKVYNACYCCVFSSCWILPKNKDTSSKSVCVCPGSCLDAYWGSAPPPPPLHPFRSLIWSQKWVLWWSPKTLRWRQTGGKFQAWNNLLPSVKCDVSASCFRSPITAEELSGSRWVI